MVELTGASSDVLSEAEKTGSEHTGIYSEKNVVETITTEEAGPINDKSKNLVFDIGETLRLKVTHVESPKEVYFMKSSDKESFSEFHKQIGKEAERLEFQADFSPEVGSLVFVKASDNQWYRGEILPMEGSSRVRFYAVEFGFTEVAQRKRVRDIPATLGTFRTRQYFGKYIFSCSVCGLARALCFSCEMLSERLGGGNSGLHRGGTGGNQGEIACLG